MRQFRLIIIVLISFLAVIPAMAADLASATYNTYVSKSGQIQLPAEFRQHWSHLGSWVVADAHAQGYGFHDVYTQPEAVKAFLENGKFIDGTVLVKEIRKISSGKLTTGEAQWAGENAVWFVMIKDSVGRFKGNANWDKGWGWALFEAKDPKTNVSKGFTESCLDCHAPAKHADWVFIEGYPTLKSK